MLKHEKRGRGPLTMSRLLGKWSKCLGKITVTKENFEKGKGEKGDVH